MIYLVYGAAGVLAVLGLLTLGAFIGWRANDAVASLGGKRAAEEVTEEQRRQFLAQQQAFEDMLHYNQDTAYGVNKALGGLRGGAEIE